jgi:anti-sigma-K factor RskA
MHPPEKRDEEREDREDQIAAYLDGETTPDEAAAFENRMRADESFRREVEQWRDALEAARDWMNADAPGIERVAQLDIPRLGPPAIRSRRSARVFSVRSLAWRAVAAAAIFAAGVFIGQTTKQGTAAQKPGSFDATQVPGVVKPDKTPAPQPGQLSPEEPRMELASAPTRVTDEKGRLVVETTLKGSGSRALWVVDGGFQIAQSSYK